MGKNNTWIIAVRKDAEDYNKNLDEDDDTSSGGVNATSLWPSQEGNRYTKGSDKKRYLSSNNYDATDENKKVEVSSNLIYDVSHKAWYNPSTGYYYNSNGTIYHDSVYRGNNIYISDDYENVTLP